MTDGSNEDISDEEAEDPIVEILKKTCNQAEAAETAADKVFLLVDTMDKSVNRKLERIERQDTQEQVRDLKNDLKSELSYQNSLLEQIVTAQQQPNKINNKITLLVLFAIGFVLSVASLPLALSSDIVCSGIGGAVAQSADGQEGCVFWR